MIPKEISEIAQKGSWAMNVCFPFLFFFFGDKKKKEIKKQQKNAKLGRFLCTKKNGIIFLQHKDKLKQIIIREKKKYMFFIHVIIHY